MAELFDIEDFHLALAQNGQGSAEIHAFRSYWADVLSEHRFLEGTANHWHGKTYYGKLSPNADLVFLSETNLQAYNTKQSDIVLGLDFMVDAHTELQSALVRQRIGAELSPTLVDLSGREGYLSANPVAGWESVHQSYNTFVAQMYNTLVELWFKRILPGTCVRRDLKIKDFSSFVQQVIAMLLENNGRAYFSLSGFVASRFCPRHVSGLYIDLAKEDEGDDRKKAEWIEDPNYQCFRNTIHKYGFRLDYNAPWRMVADINSEPMRKYMEPYGVTPQTLFKTYYYRCSNHDIPTLKEVMCGWYNTYVTSYPAITKPVIHADGGSVGAGIGTYTSSIIKERIPTSLEDVEIDFSDGYWLELYYYIRSREIGAPVDPAAFNRDIRKIMQVYKHIGLDNALDYATMLIKNKRTQYI